MSLISWNWHAPHVGWNGVARPAAVIPETCARLLPTCGSPGSDSPRVAFVSLAVAWAWRIRQRHATRRFASADRPAWLPDEDSLKTLAAGAQPVSFFCLRAPENSNKAITVCEIRDSQAQWRAFNFQTSTGIKCFRVHELPFSEGKLGGHLWDGGILAAAWALAPTEDGGARELLSGRRVLELGSGVGLLGVALAGSTAEAVVMTDFGPESLNEEQDNNNRLVPPMTLSNLEDNISANELVNADVQHLDWLDFLDREGKPAKQPAECFDRLVGSDVVYYASDLPALAAAVGAHLKPDGLGFLLLIERQWTGPLASERATPADLAAALRPYGEVKVTDLMAYCGTLDGQPMKLIELVRNSSSQSLR